MRKTMTSILLVEDDAEMVSLLGRFLPEEGYQLRVVSGHGEHAARGV